MLGDKLSQGIATGTSGTVMGSAVVNVVPANGVLVVPLGDHYMRLVGANVTLQIQDETGAWNNVTAAGVGGLVSSDAATVRWSNAGGANQNVTTQKLG